MTQTIAVLFGVFRIERLQANVFKMRPNEQG